MDFNVADSVRRDIKVLVTKTRYMVHEQFCGYENCKSFHMKYIEYKIACIEHDITKAQVFTHYISDCVNAKLFSSKTFHIYNSPTLYLLLFLKSFNIQNP